MAQDGLKRNEPRKRKPRGSNVATRLPSAFSVVGLLSAIASRPKKSWPETRHKKRAISRLLALVEWRGV